MSTWLSLMSIDSMICSMTGTSSLFVMTTMPLMRLSASMVVFSFESSPVFASPVRWFTDFFWEVPVVTLLFCPPACLELAFWLPLEELLDDAALPMRSFIMSATSSHSAYLRR